MEERRRGQGGQEAGSPVLTVSQSHHEGALGPSIVSCVHHPPQLMSSWQRLEPGDWICSCTCCVSPKQDKVQGSPAQVISMRAGPAAGCKPLPASPAPPTAIEQTPACNLLSSFFSGDRQGARGSQRSRDPLCFRLTPPTAVEFQAVKILISPEPSLFFGGGGKLRPEIRVAPCPPAGLRLLKYHLVSHTPLATAGTSLPVLEPLPATV